MILGTILVRDEDDILEDCISHHLNNGVDLFIATDNGSIDGTKDILSSFKEVVNIIDEPEHNYEQGKWVTRMARLVCEYKPDWVVHIDADEFWYGLTTLYKVDSKYGVVYLPSHYWQHPPTINIPNGTFDRSKVPYYHKYPSCGRLAHRPITDIVISQGNHGVKNQVGETYRITDESICMHHYQVRSYERFEKKIINGGKAYEKYSGDPSNGSHWKNWYAAWKKGNLRSEYNAMLVKRGQLFMANGMLL